MARLGSIYHNPNRVTEEGRDRLSSMMILKGHSGPKQMMKHRKDSFSCLLGSLIGQLWQGVIEITLSNSNLDAFSMKFFDHCSGPLAIHRRYGRGIRAEADGTKTVSPTPSATGN
jgi:hypothetical protein